MTLETYLAQVKERATMEIGGNTIDVVRMLTDQHKLLAIVEVYRSGVAVAVESLLKYKDAHLDFEVPENTGGPKDLRDLIAISHHLYGVAIEAEEIVGER